jgi:hypothetical protein
MTFGKSKQEAEAEPNRAGAGGDFIRYLKEGATTFRILQEQEEWKYYWEHFSPAGFSFPCNGEADCPGCVSDNDKMKKVSRKIAFNALSSVNGTEYVDVWKIGPMVADKLENRIKRYETITDRDYTITKYKGSGDRWDFDVEGGTPVPINLRKEEWKDIEGLLQAAWDENWGNPDLARVNRQATEMAVDTGQQRQTRRPTIAPAPKSQPEEPPFEEKVYQEADLRRMDYEDLLVLIKDDMDMVPPAQLSTSQAVVDWLMELQS